MSTWFTLLNKLTKRLPLRQWPTTKAPVVTVNHIMATGNANSQIAAAVAGAEAGVVVAEVGDQCRTAAIQTRKEILGVRNMSRSAVAVPLRFSN